MKFACMTWSLLAIAFGWLLGATVSTCYYYDTIGYGNRAENFAYSGWIALRIELIKIAMSFIIVGANRFIRIKVSRLTFYFSYPSAVANCFLGLHSVNAYQAVHSVLNHVNREAIPETHLFCVKMSAGIVLSIWILASILSIYQGLKIKGETFSMLAHTGSILAALAFAGAVGYFAARDTEMVHLARMPNEVHPDNAAGQVIEMQQRNNGDENN